MEYIVDMSCDMKVNRNCELCRQKISEIMHSLVALYSVDFVGADNTMKLKARANPYRILLLSDRYGDHGKINNLRFEGEAVAFPNGGSYGQIGQYYPSALAGNYMYPPPPPPPYGYPGNHYHPLPSKPPPKQGGEGKLRVYDQHTARPPPSFGPPPPRPLHHYSYIDPPYWPYTKSRGCCGIM